MILSEAKLQVLNKIKSTLDIFKGLVVRLIDFIWNSLTIFLSLSDNRSENLSNIVTADCENVSCSIFQVFPFVFSILRKIGRFSLGYLTLDETSSFCYTCLNISTNSSKSLIKEATSFIDGLLDDIRVMNLFSFDLRIVLVENVLDLGLLESCLKLIESGNFSQ